MIEFFYGDRQRFRYRHGDINILGRIPATALPAAAEYRLNGAAPVKLYVEPAAGAGRGDYFWGANTPSIFRLQGLPGWFNVEIPIDSPDLVAGRNEVEIRVRTGNGGTRNKRIEFDWDPRPLELPLCLGDLRHADSIQDIGQPVNGLFRLDREANAISTVAPVGPDVLLLLGSPHGSQEATYEVRFATDRRTGVYVGLSDFFVGHREQSPDLGIKPGYSTAGLATLSPPGWGQLWIADGDHLVNHESAWVVRSRYPSRFVAYPHRAYRVRHQVLMLPEANAARFRIWPAGDEEPDDWLCTLDTRRAGPRYKPLDAGSFGLFQFNSHATTWSDIEVRSLDADRQLLHDVFDTRGIDLSGPLRKVRKGIVDRWLQAFVT